MNFENLLTVQDLMERFKVSRQTIYDWRKKGWLKATINADHCKRFSEKDILRLEAILHE